MSQIEWGWGARVAKNMRIIDELLNSNVRPKSIEATINMHVQREYQEEGLAELCWDEYVVTLRKQRDDHRA